MHKYVDIKQHTYKQPISKEEITRELENSLRRLKMETHQNIWGAAKAVLRGKFIAISTPFRRPQINNVTLHLQEQKKTRTN